MQTTSGKNTLNNSSVIEKLIFSIILFTCLAVLFNFFPPKSQDFRQVFYPSASQFWNPYLVDGFINPPWTCLFLLPFKVFSIDTSVAINASLNFFVFSLLILKKEGNLSSFLICFTSTPFLHLMVSNNIEWIPALGFLLENNLGVILMLTKPQSGSLVIVNWFIHSKNKIAFITIPITIFIYSLLIWENWIIRLFTNVFSEKKAWSAGWVNISLFPWGIPIGIAILLFILIKKPKNGEILGVLSTYLIAPYFANQSLTILMALLSTKYKKFAVLLWVYLWVIQIYHKWDVVSTMFS